MIIPAWNAEKYLQRAVESVLATCYQNLEIIIVDDASLDGTWRVAEELRERCPDCVHTYQRDPSEKRGAAVTRNLGIAKSTGDYIAFLDADDWVYPWRFAEAADMLFSDPTLDAVYGKCDVICADDHALDLPVTLVGNELDSNEHVSFAEFIEHGLWHTGTILVRKVFLEKTGLFDASFKIGQDSHLWLRMALVGALRATQDPRSVSVYFRHSSNRYHSGRYHDVGRHIVEFISVWRWAVSRGYVAEANEVYRLWRSRWADGAILMARFHHFATGFTVCKEALRGFKVKEWVTLLLYRELARVMIAYARHGAGYVVHRRHGRSGGGESP